MGDPRSHDRNARRPSLSQRPPITALDHLRSRFHVFAKAAGIAPCGGCSREAGFVGRGWLGRSIADVGLFFVYHTLSDHTALLTAIDPILTGYDLEPLVWPMMLSLAMGLLAPALLFMKRRERLAFEVGPSLPRRVAPFRTNRR